MENVPYIVSVAQMQAIEARAIERGLPAAEMMERAGRGVAAYLLGKYPALQPRHCLGLIGRGNNGGDALIALIALARANWQTTALLPSPRDEMDPLLRGLVSAGGRLVVLPEMDDWATILPGLIGDSDLILDGLLGTGTRLPLHGDAERLLRALHEQPRLPAVIALDCPSGVDCDSGETSPFTLKAERTLCIEAIKQGLLKFPAALYCGKLKIIPLSLPAGAVLSEERQTRLLTRSEAKALLPTRRADAHKNTFGSALVIAGSRHYTGAAILAVSAALRSGTGLVHAAIPASLHAPLAARVPEAIWDLLPEQDGSLAPEGADLLPTILRGQQALLIGPGLGQSSQTQAFLTNLFTRVFPLEVPPPMVLDADALRLLAGLARWPELLPPGCLLTPHPGEMSALTHLSIASIQAERTAVARRYAAQWGQTVILKGAYTVVAAPDGQVVILPVATSALAHGGSGDVLAGLAVGLMAQGLTAWDAGRLAVYLHGQSARLATKRVGHPAAVLATDLIAEIGLVLKSQANH